MKMGIGKVIKTTQTGSDEQLRTTSNGLTSNETPLNTTMSDIVTAN